MQFDVIVRRICASNILEYLKEKTSQDSLTKYFTIVISNFLYNSIIKNYIKNFVAKALSLVHEN
jgi:hypothetical protein